MGSHPTETGLIKGVGAEARAVARARAITLGRAGRAVGRGTAYAVLILWAIISLMPLYWMVTTSFMLPDEVWKVPPTIVPTILKQMPALLATGQWAEAGKLWEQAIDSYRFLFQSTPVVRWITNSVIVSSVATLGVLLLDSMAAYAFAKRRFPGRELLFWIMISTLMIPGQVTLVPMFMIIRDAGLMNSLWAVILPDLSMVFGVFLLRQFMRTIPTELIEAATIDGASEFTVYSRIMVPLAKPGLATLGILTFMATWNSFLWPLIVLQRSELFTLTVGLKTLQDKNLVQYGLLMSGATVAAVPMIGVFLIFQRYFVKGLTLGGLKG
ncbi:MAG: carbohydrate ABC transporter permease [Bacillota bacterium]